jgi:hypothetical protein
MDTIVKLQEEYETLQRRIEALKEEAQGKSKTLIKEVLKAFFLKYDGVVHNVFWTQYTPYFNDGEACEFSVRDVYLTLESESDVESEDDEGSVIYDEDDILNIKKRIETWEDFRENPNTAALKYQKDYIKKYNRDPFDYSYRSWQQKTVQQAMAEWKPDYVSEEELRQKLVTAENLVANYSSLKVEFNAVKKLISSIDEDVMRVMFGDHVKIVATKYGVEIENYDHE